MSNDQQVTVRGQNLNIDIIEKFIAAGLLTFFAIRFIPPVFEQGTWLNIVLLAAEAMVVLFILLRRPSVAISNKPTDWLAGFGATSLPFFAVPVGTAPIVPAALCGLVMILGLAMSIGAKLTLRRSFGLVAANRGVVTSGPYRLVRHPIYAGYLLTHIGYILSGPNVWNIAIYGATTALQIVRILAEERVLKADPRYQEMCSKVRYRLVPFVF